MTQPAAARRVVIAEDEALIRLDLREMLEEEGWAVVGEAGDGETAVRLAEDLRPDLVLLDVQMPVLDGLAAAERIARQRVAPVVMLTAFGQRDLVERAREAGAMAYLVKPFAKKDLVPAVEMAVSRFAEIVGLEAEVTGLQDRLEARKTVERAKGVLQDRHGMTEPQAFRWIQTTSMNRRLSMRAVAEAVLAEAAPPGPGPAESVPAGTDPSGTDPSGVDPSGTDPSGVDPSGVEPSGTAAARATPGGRSGGATAPGRSTAPTPTSVPEATRPAEAAAPADPPL